MKPLPSGSSSESDAIVGYRTFVAVIAAAYVTLIALTPRTGMMMTQEISWAQLLPLSGLYLLLGISGFDYARRRSSLPISLAYLLIEFGIGMRINMLAWEGSLPLILLPLAAQAVVLLPRVLAAGMCMLVIAGVSGNLSWVPAWPHWLRNIAQATAAVVFVVVYVGVAQREREARQRTEALAAEVAQLAAANERNRMAREIHDTLGHYLTVIHVQLEAARAIIGRDPERGMLAVTRAQALAKDGLTAVRQSVKALREEGSVDGIAEQIASLVESVRDERFSSPCIVRRSKRSPTSASTGRGSLGHGASLGGAHRRARNRHRPVPTRLRLFWTWKSRRRTGRPSNRQTTRLGLTCSVGLCRGGGPPNLHPCDRAFAEVMRLQQVVDSRSPSARRFGSKLRTIRRGRERWEQPKLAILLGNLEAPPGFEPGMEVLQTSPGRLCC